MASSKNYVKGRENLSTGIIVNILGLRLVVGNVVLSLRPGGGDALSWVQRGAPKNKRRSTKKYMHTTAKWLN